MSWLRDLVAVYARVLRRGIDLAVRHWWLGFVATAYQAVLLLLIIGVTPLGRLGGFIVIFGMAALVSSWLVLVGGVVRDGRTSLADVPGSFGVYLGDVLTVGFLLWALQYVAAAALGDQSYLAIVFELALLVFLSAVPEQIYLGGESGAAIFLESYRFVAANWIEWLPPTGVLLTILLAAGTIPYAPAAVVADGLALAFMFIVRGLLFLELTTSSRRAREFRRAAG